MVSNRPVINKSSQDVRIFRLSFQGKKLKLRGKSKKLIGKKLRVKKSLLFWKHFSSKYLSMYKLITFHR